MLAFEDESYVRLYTRDTPTWMRLGFAGQAVFALLLRKVDRAGVLGGVTDPAADVALITGAPLDVATAGVERLLATGTLEHRGDRLVMPRFIDAQTAKKSDRLRSLEARGRRRDLSRAGGGEGSASAGGEGSASADGEGSARPGETIEPATESAEPPREPEPASRGVTIEPSSGADPLSADASRGVSVASRAVTDASRAVSPSSRGDTRRHAPSRSSLAVAKLSSDPPLAPPGVPAAGSSDTQLAEPERRGKRSARARSLCPEDFEPNDATLAKAAELGFSSKLERKTRTEFVNFWRFKGELRADWNAGYRNRLEAVADKLGLKPIAPADLELRRRYQAQLRKANAPPTAAAPPPHDFDAKLGGLFGG